MDEKDSRILVVDDEQDLCEILKFNLETEGYQVETANSAEEALEKDIASYNLLLLDVMMGGMSGFQLAKQLKNSEVTAHIPIIFLTARDTENDTVTGFNLGADDYISKPFSIREVMVRVRAVLRRTASRLEGAEEPAVISYQGLLLNLDKKSVSVDGEDVPFTKTEFELLRLLLEERGRAIPICFPMKFRRWFCPAIWNLLQSVWKQRVNMSALCCARLRPQLCSPAR